GGWRNIAITSIWLAAAILTTPYYALFLLVFTAFIITDALVRQRRQALRQILRVAATIAVFAILVSPLLARMLVIGRSEGRSMNPAYDIDRFSVDVLAFIVPSPLHPLWRRVVDPIYAVITRHGSNAEIVVFAGFVPLLLGVVGLKKYRKVRNFWLPLSVA